MTEPTITRRNFQRTLLGTTLLAGGVSGCWGLPGCTPSDQTQQTNAATTEKNSPKVSTVPLRIWIAGAVRQPESIIRQWNAHSEQPIDIRSLSVEELLAQQKCASDLLLYPSRLIGELHQRQWIVKLPSGLSKLAKLEQDKRSAEEEEFVPAPAGLISAASYDGVMYGLPLGYSMINLLGSTMVKNDKLTWQQLQDSLSAVQRRPLKFDESRIDKNAVVDRFLCIAFGNTKSNTKYGVLFDIHTLKARLNSSEFLFAGDLLQALACQLESAESVIGTHSAAWQWVNQTQQPGFALVSPSHLDADTSQLDSAQYIPLVADKTNQDGSGILGSVTNHCQQTAQAAQFLQWIFKPKTLEALRGQVVGLISTTARGRTLADRVLAANSSTLQLDNLISEPRMPGTEVYRTILAEQLLDFLRGESNCQVALAVATEAWDRITKEKVTNAKSAYEKSLGL